MYTLGNDINTKIQFPQKEGVTLEKENGATEHPDVQRARNSYKYQL